MKLIKTRYALAIWLACALAYGLINSGIASFLQNKAEQTLSDVTAPRAATGKSEKAGTPQAAVALEITTVPRNARVRIIEGTDETYKKGMLLPPGDYRIQISAAGFPSKTVTHKHHAGNSRLTVDLSQGGH